MTDLEAFCADLERRIEDEYKRLGYGIGWRLLASPKTTLKSANIALIGLNPGGDRDYPEHPRFSMPVGKSSYVDEKWGNHQRGKAPLQNQVRSIFTKLGAEPHEVLCGEFIPFRSRNYRELAHKKEARAFARELWRDIFAETKPELIMAMGMVAFEELNNLLGGVEAKKIPINWGRVKARHTVYSDTTLVGIPHLSQYRFINREESQEGLNDMLGDFFA